MPVAYCGPSPEPNTLLAAWNFDAAAFGLCAALIVAHLYRGDTSQRGPLAAAIATLLILFISPLCALTVALFSARVAHHVLLVGVAAPLLAVAFPQRAGSAWRLPLSLLAGFHAVVLWFWHAPQAYQWGISAALPYWTMQLTLLGSAYFLWRGVLSVRVYPGQALFALLATVIQMGMLGALLTFAQRPLYAQHFLTTDPFGLSALEDQQLAGLIMWVPAALPYVAAALWLLWGWRSDEGAGRARPVGGSWSG